MATLTGTAGKTSAEDWSNVLAEVPLFEGLSKRHVRAISKLATVSRVPNFSEIVRVGEPGNSFYLVLEGTATVRVPGKRAGKLGPGDAFGELALLDDAPRSGTVQATSDMLVARIGRASFVKMLQKEPKVAIALLKTLSGRLRSTEAPARH
jgi:CRP/FNR family transcriptional regulator, cyclic AMP receptor protein